MKEKNCTSCDGSGLIHRADGEYLGRCNCSEDTTLPYPNTVEHITETDFVKNNKVAPTTTSRESPQWVLGAVYRSE